MIAKSNHSGITIILVVCMKYSNIKGDEMNGALGHDNLDEWDEFLYESYPSAGLFARPDDLQSSTLPLCYGCPLKGSNIHIQAFCSYWIGNNAEYLIITIQSGYYTLGIR